MVLNKELIICADGFGYDLISEENTPFLYKAKKLEELQRLETLFAFTGIEYSFFTGKEPEENKIWLEFSRTKDSIFKNLLLRFLSFNKKLRTYFGIFLQLLNGRTYLCSLHNIPSDKLKFFDSSVKYGLWKLPFFQGKNFAFYKWPFFITQKNGREKRKIIIKYENDEERLKRLVKEKDKDIYYTQLVGLDKIIHKYGKKSREVSNYLKKTDKLLWQISKGFEKFVIWSDHGFADIKNYINIEKILPKCEDYFYFIAGTTISFWFKNQKIRRVIEEKFSKIKELKKLTPEITKKYRIPFSENYGELIYFVDKRNYFFPNFYQKSLKERFVSMHGYSEDKELDGFIFIKNNGKSAKKNLKIKDIMGILQ